MTSFSGPPNPVLRIARMGTPRRLRASHVATLGSRLKLGNRDANERIRHTNSRKCPNQFDLHRPGEVRRRPASGGFQYAGYRICPNGPRITTAAVAKLS